MSLNLLPQSAVNRWPLIPLRLIVGYGFMEHGFAKLAKGPDAFASILQAIGVPAPHFMAWSTILRTSLCMGQDLTRVGIAARSQKKRLNYEQTDFSLADQRQRRLIHFRNPKPLLVNQES